MKRRHILIFGFALVPTLLLAVGWREASLRAHELSLRDRETRLEQEIRSVRSAVDESLEELRQREDERPFYMYNKYYSPPEVIALNDPVAISPLAHDPRDPRIMGYFQVEPDGALRTPYTQDETEHSTREDSIRAIVTSSEFTEERSNSGRGLQRNNAREGRGGYGVEPGATDDRPVGPLTTNLREWGNNVVEDLRQAQAGSQPAEQRVSMRGRSAPMTNRYPIEVQSTQGEAQIQRVQARVVPEPEEHDPLAGLEGLGELDEVLRTPANAVFEMVADVEGPIQGAIAQDAADVGYEAMRWSFPGEHIALQRIVSHEGVSVAQGVLLASDHLREGWLPRMVSRHTGEEYAPAIVERNADATCAVRGTLSEVLPFDLCFAPSALATLQQGFEEELQLQLGMLLGLLVIVLLAIGVVMRASSRAEELAEQKSAFVSAVSHELRTPLTTIRMHAEMLAEGLVSAKRRPQVHDELAQESIRLARLVDNVLEVSRLEHGQRPLRIKHADLCAHIRSVVDGQRRFIESKAIGIILTLPESAEASFEAQAMEQILVNLLDNAVKYGRGSDLEVRVNVEGPSVVLRVLDRGPGIPEALHESVFERFYRVEREEDAHAPGTGIGLALVRELARAQGGEAEVRDRRGGGTEAVVTLLGPAAP